MKIRQLSHVVLVLALSLACAAYALGCGEETDCPSSLVIVCLDRSDSFIVTDGGPEEFCSCLVDAGMTCDEDEKCYANCDAADFQECLGPL